MFEINIIRDEFPTDRELKIHKRSAVRGVVLYEDKLLLVKTKLGDYKFPGGGIDKYEDDYSALRREIKEETGYVDVTIGFCLGTALEQNIDNFCDGYMFQMDSKYYLCKLNSLAKEERVLEQYEQDMEFTEMFVDVEDAYNSNKKLFDSCKDSVIDKLGMKVTDWLERETVALEKISNCIYFNALWDIFECGQIMKCADRTQVMIDGKEGHANFVTNYDKMIQQELKKRLLNIYPDADFVGEEDDDIRPLGEGLSLIVDPIDGTTNFMKDYGVSCISVGMVLDKKQIAGIVYQPYTNEMFCAEKDKGAFLNGKRIHVSKATMDQALVIFGTAPYYEDLKEKSFKAAKEVLGHCIDVRRSGSAAMDLCTVAAGRADMFFEYLICPWDIAAGSLIVTEAGGEISTVLDEDITLEQKCSIKATNGVVKFDMHQFE